MVAAFNDDSNLNFVEAVPEIKYTSGKPRLTHVANSVSGIDATGLGRVEVSNKT